MDDMLRFLGSSALHVAEQLRMEAYKVSCGRSGAPCSTSCTCHIVHMCRAASMLDTFAGALAAALLLLLLLLLQAAAQPGHWVQQPQQMALLAVQSVPRPVLRHSDSRTHARSHPRPPVSAPAARLLPECLPHDAQPCHMQELGCRSVLAAIDALGAEVHPGSGKCVMQSTHRLHVFLCRQYTRCVSAFSGFCS